MNTCTLINFEFKYGNSEVLEKHQIECVEGGNYIEAELAKNKIKELKEQNTRRKKEELKTRHLNEVF